MKHEELRAECARLAGLYGHAAMTPQNMRAAYKLVAQVPALLDENEALKKTSDAMLGDIRRLLGLTKELEARIAELERDAARYRSLTYELLG